MAKSRLLVILGHESFKFVASYYYARALAEIKHTFYNLGTTCTARKQVPVGSST